jgi:hypothetical protein
VPKGTSCCSACRSSHSTSAPVLTAPEHQPVVHREGPGRPWWVGAAPELPIAVLGAARRQLDVPRSADIIYKVCPDVPSGPVRSESCWNSSQGTPGCALTCALKNRAYGASVPAGGVCLQGQFDGTTCIYLVNVGSCSSTTVRILKWYGSSSSSSSGPAAPRRTKWRSSRAAASSSPPRVAWPNRCCPGRARRRPRPQAQQRPRPPAGRGARQHRPRTSRLRTPWGWTVTPRARGRRCASAAGLLAVGGPAGPMMMP